MRLNRYIATYSGLSRRKADSLIEEGKVVVNRKTAHMGMIIAEDDVVFVDGRRLFPVKKESLTVLLNKPTGFVCSKDGQGSPTVYDLLQKRMSHLNIAGRLDKESSGLVVLTDDGHLQQELTHPKYNKEKVYLVTTKRPLIASEIKKLEAGVNIGDKRLSKLLVSRSTGGKLKVSLREGRNRQIRRSFEAIGHEVTSLHRTILGSFKLGDLKLQEFVEVEN